MGLAEKGLGGEQLREIESLIGAENCDLYDVLAYIAYALAPVTRAARVEARRADIVARYDDKLGVFLELCWRNM